MTIRTRHAWSFIAGAAVMYYLDPDRGARRRGLLRDRLVHLNRKLGSGLDAAARDARNRSAGLVARARRRLRADHASDTVIEQRVRARLGRVVSHAGAIDVRARDGIVTLSGAIPAVEVDDLIAETRKVRGVRGVHTLLEVHRAPERVPALQGSVRRTGARPELLQENWAPAIRLAAGGAGAAALVGGLRRGGAGGVAAQLLGGALLARAATNLPARRLVGVNAGRRAVVVRKAITVDAPVERVWDLWSRFETFPRFMAHLEEVRPTEGGRSHWTAAGPGGLRFEWDAEITRWVPHESIAWKSVEGASVASAGVVRFDPVDENRTRIDIRLSYSPPAGAIGHAIASIFGSDPKRAMDEDLVRLKSLLEVGKATAGGQTATPDSLR